MARSQKFHVLETCPLNAPKRPTCAEARYGITFATGLPIFNTMISSPACARSITAENFAFASVSVSAFIFLKVQLQYSLTWSVLSSHKKYSTFIFHISTNFPCHEKESTFIIHISIFYSKYFRFAIILFFICVNSCNLRILKTLFLPSQLFQDL